MNEETNVNSRLFSNHDWEAHSTHAHYQYATLATELGLSHRTLRRRIAIAFHAAPHKWLEAMRLRKAAELLPLLSVKEIAAQLGFKQVSHFSANFRRFYGICPSQYRISDARHRALWAKNAAQRRAL